MDKSKLLKLILGGGVVLLIGSALALSRDYQDTWILEGIEIPFVIFVSAYVLTFLCERNTFWLVALAALGRAVFLAIPSLKYVWFQGTAIDQHQQFALANYVYNEGHIATQVPPLVSFYSKVPVIHLDFSILSVISKIPVVDSVKYLPVFLSPIYPLLTYIILKKLNASNETTLLKYGLFFSSIPFSAEEYVVTGSQFGVLLIFLILATLITLLSENERHRWLVFILFVLVLPMTHSVSSLLLSALFLGFMLLQHLSYFRLKLRLPLAGAIMALVSCVSWLVFSSTLTFEKILNAFFGGVIKSTALSPTEVVPLRFFDLLRVDLVGSLKIVLTSYGLELFLLSLELLGMIILLRTRRQLSQTSRFLFLVGSLMLALIPISFLSKVGIFRAMFLAGLLSPILSGIFVSSVFKRKVWLRTVIAVFVVLLAILQLYPPQFLIPPANVLVRGLPADEPIVFVGQVNTIYQRQMIVFAERYIDGKIACDTATMSQIIGLTSLSYSSTNLSWYYPLDRNQPVREYDYFLVHLPGVSGRIDESAEIRTENAILGAIYDSSIAYTNGKSWVLRP